MTRFIALLAMVTIAVASGIPFVRGQELKEIGKIKFEIAQGKVTAIDANKGQATISIGTDAGLKGGKTLDVYRLKPMRVKVGSIIVIDVRKKDATGVMRPTKNDAPIQLDDVVEEDEPRLPWAISADGKTLAAVRKQDPNQMSLWDVATGKELHVLKGHKGNVGGMEFSRDSKRFVSFAADNLVKVWEVASGKEIQTLKGRADQGRLLRISPDGKYVTLGSESLVKLWEVTTLKEVASWRTGREAVLLASLGFSGDGQTLVCSSTEGLQLIVPRTGQVNPPLKSEGGLCTDFVVSLDGKKVAGGFNNGSTLQIVDVATGKSIATLEAKARESRGAWAVGFADDGKTLVFSDGPNIMRYDLVASKVTVTMAAPQNGSVFSAFSPNGKFLAWKSEGGLIRVLEVPEN